MTTPKRPRGRPIGPEKVKLTVMISQEAYALIQELSISTGETFGKLVEQGLTRRKKTVK